MHKKNILLDHFIAFLNTVKSVFLSGLFTVLPIAFTLFFITFAYRFVYRILEPLRPIIPEQLHSIVGAEFILVTVLILFIGIILRIFVIKSIVSYAEKIISKIPLIRIVYSSAKMLVDFFKMSEHASPLSRKVVLIQYPRRGNYHIAFLLEPAENNYQKLIPDAWKDAPNDVFYKVFMPNSPNPTTGYFFIMPKHEIIDTDITFEEAIKVLVSCGLSTPESLNHLASKKNVPPSL